MGILKSIQLHYHGEQKKKFRAGPLPRDNMAKSVWTYPYIQEKQIKEKETKKEKNSEKKKKTVRKKKQKTKKEKKNREACDKKKEKKTNV